MNSLTFLIKLRITLTIVYDVIVQGEIFDY